MLNDYKDECWKQIDGLDFKPISIVSITGVNGYDKFSLEELKLLDYMHGNGKINPK